MLDCRDDEPRNRPQEDDQKNDEQQSAALALVEAVSIHWHGVASTFIRQTYSLYFADSRFKRPSTGLVDESHTQSPLRRRRDDALNRPRRSRDRHGSVTLNDVASGLSAQQSQDRGAGLLAITIW